MNVKSVLILSTALLFFGTARISLADNKDTSMKEMVHHEMEHSGNDKRISLELTAEMKQHLLVDMREHLEAVQAITGLIAEGKFDKASEIANSNLGMSEEEEEEEKMCDMSGNADFKSLAQSFHKSGDTLTEVLKTRDVNKSLHALHDTLNYCVQCHATYRQ